MFVSPPFQTSLASLSFFFCEEKEIDQALFPDGNAETTAGLSQRGCLDTQGTWLAVALQPPHQPSRLRSMAGGLVLAQEDTRGNKGATREDGGGCLVLTGCKNS